MIKKGIAYLLSWLFYWLGDFTANLMHLIDFFGYVYPVYNMLMRWSISIQDWGGNTTPWSRCQTHKDNV